MNRIILRLLFCAVILQSCGDTKETDDNLPPFVLDIENQPSAKPADDNKASGVYKGTFVGSTGTFKLIIQSNLIIGYLAIKNDDAWPESYVLTTDDIEASDLNGAITNALFTNVDQTVKLYFSVNADGSNPEIELDIAGHETIDVAIYKETSETLIKIYEGFLYRTYVDEGVQVKAHFNVLLGPDSLARITYKSVEEYGLENGISGTKGEESYSSDANYRIDVWPNITQISIYRHIPNPLDSYTSEFYFSSGEINGTEIIHKTQWEQEGFIYADSARLKRVL